MVIRVFKACCRRAVMPSRLLPINSATIPRFTRPDDLSPTRGDRIELFSACNLRGIGFLARPERLELPAYSFEASRSIQLSYGRASPKPHSHECLCHKTTPLLPD